MGVRDLESGDCILIAVNCLNVIGISGAVVILIDLDIVLDQLISDQFAVLVARIGPKIK